jgi:hypothetical protein
MKGSGVVGQITGVLEPLATPKRDNYSTDDDF